MRFIGFNFEVRRSQKSRDNKILKRRLAGFTYKQIGDELGIHATNVRKSLVRISRQSRRDGVVCPLTRYDKDGTPIKFKTVKELKNAYV